MVRSGVAFQFEGEEGEEGRLVPLLQTRLACVFNTSDCSEEREMQLGDPLDGFWKTIAFGGCGVEKVVRRNFYEVFLSTAEMRASWLDQVERMLRDGLGW